MNKEQELITAQEAAEALGLSVETIWRYTREQKIPHLVLGNKQYRYRLSEVLGALSQNQVREGSASYLIESRGKKLSLADYLQLPPDSGYGYELLDGLLIKDPSPTVLHQRVSRRLQRLLEDYFAVVDPEGEVFGAPLDVALGNHTVVQPDIFYLAGHQKQLVLDRRIDGPPTLLVEILSPSTSRKDRVTKLRIYQESGIPHYWLVSPDERCLECFALRAGAYSIVAGGIDAEVVQPPDFKGLSLDLKLLWRKK